MLQGLHILKRPGLCCYRGEDAAAAWTGQTQSQRRGMRGGQCPPSQIKGSLPPRCQHREASHVTAVSQCHRSGAARKKKRTGETGQCLSPEHALWDGLSGLGPEGHSNR